MNRQDLAQAIAISWLTGCSDREAVAIQKKQAQLAKQAKKS